jgi:isopentenyl-diphosphate delta-isomerase
MAEATSMAEAMREAVSFDTEPLILVDEHDREIGHRNKSECHLGHGTLHRAFSVFLFDHRGRVLLQRRSALKPLWPMFWSNSCCSHPRRGESLEQATRRRVREELGVEAGLHWLYRFIYQADYLEVGAEHELCHVYIGAVADPVIRVHPDEVAEIDWLTIDELGRRIQSDPERYTPWFKLEWEELMARHRDRIERLIASVSS